MPNSGLARIVYNGADGVKKSPETAVKLYEAAAQAGPSGVATGRWPSWRKGNGVTAGINLGPPNGTAGGEEGRRSRAQNNLGLMSERQGHHPRSQPCASIFSTQAAKGDDAFAMNNLGGMYRDGLGDAGRDKQRAIEMARRRQKGVTSSHATIYVASALPYPKRPMPRARSAPGAPATAGPQAAPARQSAEVGSRAAEAGADRRQRGRRHRRRQQRRRRRRQHSRERSLPASLTDILNRLLTHADTSCCMRPRIGGGVGSVGRRP